MIGHAPFLSLQVVLTFVVLDWDGPLVGDDLMGMAKLTFPDVRIMLSD